VNEFSENIAVKLWKFGKSFDQAYWSWSPFPASFAYLTTMTTTMMMMNNYRLW